MSASRCPLGGAAGASALSYIIPKWKKAFADSVDHGEQDTRFKDWVENLRPANFLAGGIRHRWSIHLKKQVENHLNVWFREEDLPVPPNLLKTLYDDKRSPDDELRRRLIACVRLMTKDELERVQIPSSALLPERWDFSRYINIAPNAHLRGRRPCARKIPIPN